MDGVIWAREGASGIESNNANDASTEMFVDAASGDLHLTAQAVGAIDRGIASESMLDDWDGDGWDEVAVSAQWAEVSGFYGAGTTSVWSGGTLYP